MDRSSLNFLYGANVKTATEASLRASQVASSVSALVRNKTSMFGVLVRFWAWYAGEQSQINEESGLSMNDSLITKPMGASEIAQLVNLFNNDLLSKHTVLEELQRGGVLDPDLVLEKAMERIDEDKEAEHELQHQEAEQKLGEDLKRANEFQKQAPTEPGQGGEKQSATEKQQQNTEKAAEQAK